MTTLPFLKNYYQVLQGTQNCIDQKLLMPSLILIYTLIDTLAWASSDKNTGVRKSFEAWVTKWLLSSLPCTATELYAARCGILHTLTSKADLTKGGKVREIAYAWGTAKSENLQDVIEHFKNKQLVAVHVNVLFQAVRLAMVAMLEKSDADHSLEKCLNEAAAMHLVLESPDKINQFLELISDKPGA